MTLSLYQIHEKLVEEHRLLAILDSDIERKRSTINEKHRKILLEYRSLCFMNTWYPILSLTNVSDFLKSSIYKRGEHRVVDIDDIPSKLGDVRKMKKFLRNFEKYSSLLWKCADIYFSGSDKNPKYNPCSKTISLFAASTFPALYGYCWSKEEGIEYVSKLCIMLELQVTKATKKNDDINEGGVYSYDFRTRSYIREIVRQFFHMQGVQKYLSHAIGSRITDMLHDERLFKDEEIFRLNSEQLVILLEYAQKFGKGLVESMCHFPSLVKHFFKKAHEIAGDKLIKILFFDFMLKPALVNPKLFALIPETAHVPNSCVFTDLSRLFWFAANPQLLENKHEEHEPLKGLMQDERFHQLKGSFDQLFEKLINHDGEVSLISRTELGNTIDYHYKLMCISVNDLALIADIVNAAAPNIEGDEDAVRKLKEAVNFNINLHNDKVHDFWFKRSSKDKNPSANDDLEVALPVLGPDNVTSTPEFSAEIKYIAQLLQDTRPDRRAPENFIDFLNFQKERARSIHSLKTEIRCQAAIAKMVNLDQDTILPSLNVMANNYLAMDKRKLALAFRHQEFVDSLSTIVRNASTMSSQLTPIIHQAILNLFLTKKSHIKTEIAKNQASLLDNVHEWQEKFPQLVSELTAFATSLGLSDPKHHNRLSRQFHSELCTKLPFEQFKKQHTSYGDKDKALTSQYKEILEKFLQDKYSKALEQLFQNPGCFGSAINTLRNGTARGAPLERLERISECMVIIQDIYLFEAGEGCPGDDFLPLVVYTLLRTELSGLTSLSMYMQHLLISLNDSVKLLDSKEKYVTTTFLTAIDAISSMMSK